MRETAIREAREETGVSVSPQDVAFVTEFRSTRWGADLQVYYHASVSEPISPLRSVDPDVEDVRFVPTAELRRYVSFRPWLVPLEQWLAERATRYHFFDLDREPAET